MLPTNRWKVNSQPTCALFAFKITGNPGYQSAGAYVLVHTWRKCAPKLKFFSLTNWLLTKFCENQESLKSISNIQIRWQLVLLCGPLLKCVSDQLFLDCSAKGSDEMCLLCYTVTVFLSTQINTKLELWMCEWNMFRFYSDVLLGSSVEKYFCQAPGTEDTQNTLPNLVRYGQEP